LYVGRLFSFSYYNTLIPPPFFFSLKNNEEAWDVLGIIYGRVRKHHLDDELEAKQKVYDLIQSTGGADNYSCDVMNNLATAYIHHEMYVKAEVMLRDVIKLCPWDDFPYSNLASALHHQGQEEEAQIAFEKGKKVRDKWSTPDMVTVGNEELML
jgi:tetratricopeptide (TPR) repeat protein